MSARPYRDWTDADLATAVSEAAERLRSREQERDHVGRILSHFLDAREYYRDTYDWDDEREAEEFVSWVQETVDAFLDGKYDGGPHDPRESRRAETA